MNFEEFNQPPLSKIEPLTQEEHRVLVTLLGHAFTVDGLLHPEHENHPMVLRTLFTKVTMAERVEK